jgi:hypothetical protein
MSKKDGWLGRPARAANRGGMTAGRCGCPRGTMSKRRLAWTTGACREPEQEDSGTVRLRTLRLVQKGCHVSTAVQKQKRRRSVPFHLRFYGFAHQKNKRVFIALYSLAGILSMLL